MTDYKGIKEALAEAEEADRLLDEMQHSKLHIGMVTEGAMVTEDANLQHKVRTPAVVIWLERTEGAHGYCSQALHAELVRLLRAIAKEDLRQELARRRDAGLKRVRGRAE